MTEQLHNLIDSGATQAVINERIVGLLEAASRASEAANRITGDHERRIRFLERAVYLGAGGLGIITAVLELVKILK